MGAVPASGEVQDKIRARVVCDEAPPQTEEKPEEKPWSMNPLFCWQCGGRAGSSAQPVHQALHHSPVVHSHNYKQTKILNPETKWTNLSQSCQAFQS